MEMHCLGIFVPRQCMSQPGNIVPGEEDDCTPTFRYTRETLNLKDHTTHYACLSLIYSIFIHVMLLTIISQRILPCLLLYFSKSSSLSKLNIQVIHPL
ncbi:hypothetical protein LDENG_00181650 [Lucifuga dentata]|nr:hypothetical protein LDENG_00181650 [Lucifuga dentata]